MTIKKCLTLIVFFHFVFLPMVGAQEDVPVDTLSVKPGSSVTLKGKVVELYGGNLEVGENFIDKINASDVSFPFKNKVTLVNIVPSLDTPVCELQTYKISTMDIDPLIDVITVSRDLPMAQVRFAREHEMSSEGFISDYKSGSFGKSTGLMMKDKELLARGLMVLDSEGIIRYIQIVPEVSHLPDISKALEMAQQLIKK